MSFLTRWHGAPLFSAVLLVYLACPPFPSYDSYWTIPTALQLLRHGTTTVDEFVPAAPAVAQYGLDCVPAHGPGRPYSADPSCAGGHWYNIYPVGVPVLVSPVVASLIVATRVTTAAGWRPSRPLLAAFVAGDLAGARALTELVCASLICAVTAWIVYLTAARFLSPGRAAAVAFLCAFGTSQWSVASRSLLQHGPSALFLALSIWIAVIALDNPARIRFLSLPLAAAFAVRPSNAVAVAALSVYVAVHYRAWFLRFLAWSLPVAIPFLTYNLMVRHALFPTYYTYAWAARSTLFSGLAMNLFSPSRGLLIFTPLVLISAAGMLLAWRRRWCYPLTLYVAAIVAAHSVVIALYWPGHGYGPRYYADLSAVFVFFLIPAILLWPKSRVAAALVFVVLAAWSVFVHARGATSAAANLWSATPVNVDEAPRRVWDWHDAQFLRGL